jgi:asparagine synthase (glutamine-hydrolysing)
MSLGDFGIELEHVESMVERLEGRGPERQDIWAGEGVALGHALLATTPEALVEKLPLHHGESGCTVTADVRLDNRDQLLLALGIRAAGRTLGDGELILLAYLKWGEDCVRHLLGDFAFAIWDPRSRRLVCARDQLGMRQLTYAHVPGRVFAFATEPAAVLQEPAISKKLNLGRIADFLDDLEHFDLAATFYSAVQRLPPAHTLTVDGRGLRLRKYWRLETPTELKLSSDGEYVEAFLDVFREAVRCRLRSAGKVGSTLSGGMDSGSVTAIAAELLAEEGSGPLPTFSAIGFDPQSCPETRAILAAAQMPGIEPHFVSFTELGPYWAELVRLTEEEAEPFDGEMALFRSIYLAAREVGINVMLDGAAGDVILYSDSWAARLLRRGRILRAVKEVRGESHFWGPFRTLLVGAAARAWLPRQARALRRQALWWWADRRIGRSTLISAEFAARSNLRQRRRQFRDDNSRFDRLDERERARRIENARLTVGRERYDRVASSVGLEARDPFMDLRLIDVCLSMPWDQLQAAGWPKILLRRATAGKLPDSVRWRRGKEHLGGAFTEEIFARLTAVGGSPERFDETIAPYVDLRRLKGGPARERCNDWVQAVCLYHWLQNVESGENRS